MLQIPKQPNQVRGNTMACINYAMCPLCYGCRNFDPRDPDCIECYDAGVQKNRNFNVCNKKLHNDVALNMMTTRNRINIDDYKEVEEDFNKWKN